MVVVGVLGLAQHAVGHGRLGVHRVRAGHVYRHGVEGGEHAHIWHHGGVVFKVAVAVGGDVYREGDVEVRLALADGLGVLGDLAVEDVVGLVVCGADGVLGTYAYAAAAADAAVVVDVALAVLYYGRAVGADALAGAASCRPWSRRPCRGS